MSLEFALTERNRVANDFFGGVDFVIRAYSNTISATGTGGSELTTGGYSEIEIENNLTNFPTATTGTRSNAVEFFRDFDEDASIASIGIFNADTDAFLARKVYDEPFEVGAGQKWRFAVGSITFNPMNS